MAPKRVTSVDKEVQTNVYLQTDTVDSDLKTDTGDSDNNVDEERFVILQNIDREECPFCLCKPCVTHENNRQLWWEKDPFTPLIFTISWSTQFVLIDINAFRELNRNQSLTRYLTSRICLVWFEHILLNLFSKGQGTSSQTYFALSLYI